MTCVIKFGIPVRLKMRITKYYNRAISVTSFFAKVFEKIMCNVVTNFLAEHVIISKFQFGFRKKHGNHIINTKQKFQLHIFKEQADLYVKGFYCLMVLEYYFSSYF